MSKNKIILITGGSSGIGSEIAVELAKDGAEVIINFSKSKIKADEVKEEIELIGGKAHLYQADITDENQLVEMFKFVEENFEYIDVLINNAGIYLPEYIETHDINSWDTMFNLNLKAKLMCTKYATPLLKKSSSPRIINIASRAAIKPMEESSAYCCAAAAIIMLSQVSAIELSMHNIKVNTVSPGLTKTPMTEAVETKEDFRDYVQRNPSKRLGTTFDIAKTVKFLISDDAEFINGENINVSGGIVLV